MGPEQIRWIFQAVLILILAICVHEFGHAIVADKLGDRLPRSQGRVTLNPIKHADPIGTLGFPLMALIFTKGASLGFGWGKPVQVRPTSFSRRFSMRTGHMMVAFAGPMMNILFGVVISLVLLGLLKGGVITPSGDGRIPDSILDVVRVIPDSLHEVLLYAIFLNFILFFFNLIPAPPLDGGAVMEGLLPKKYLPQYQKLAVYGPFILMAVIFIPNLSKVFVMPAVWLSNFWLGLIGVL